ncbi:MAG: PilZ domain-containing protein [Terriglobales bacterium]
MPLEVPVRVTSLSPAAPFSEQCNTTLVNAHGCGVIAPRAITQGIQVRLEIVSAKRGTTARVAEIVSLGGDPETWLVGLELDAPGNFWGIDYAPTDWKIEESALPAVPQPVAAEPSAQSKAHLRRWRLADISAGACYLETAEPFPTGSPVLLSIRTTDMECLLDGTVRVSHPRTGMGVEFTGAPARERQARVEELINRLKSNSEVPKIFVGRKEERKQGRTLEGNDGAKGGQHAAEISAADAAENDELADPLLELILEGPSLTAEQFLNDLRAQRLGKRRDPRIDLALPVLLTGIDVGGRPLDQRVFTINISRRGALLEGVHGMLRPDDKISLSRAQRREEFRVAWVGEDGTGAAGQIGVAAVDPNTSFWSEVLETMVQSRLETASIRERIPENDRENDGGNGGA